MSNLIPFDEKLPAHLQAAAADANSALTQGVGAGFPVLSIKGKAFTIVSDGVREIITKPDDEDEPASSLEIVIIDANPMLSKIYYEKAFEDGSTEKPDCYSNDGRKPAADAQHPQCKTCAACPHNAWGSGKEGRGKACSDARRIAVAPVGQVNEPLLLRVPPTSLKPLQEYGTMLAKRGVAFNAVVTKLSFHAEESSPKLKFKPLSFLDEETHAEVLEVQADEVVVDILGMRDAPVPDEAEDEPAPAKRKAREVPKPKPKPKAEVVDDDDDDDDDEDEAAAAELAAKAKALKKKAAKERKAKAAAEAKAEREAKAAAEAEAEDDDDDDDDEDDEPVAKQTSAEDDLDALLAEFDD